MKFKKILLISCSLLLMALVVVACSSDSPTPPANNGDTTTPGNTTEPGKDQQVPPKDEEPVQKQNVYLYFSDQELMEIYREPREIEVPSDGNVAKAALEAWIAGPNSEKLNSLIPTDVVIESMEVKDGIAYVSFSKEITNANLGSTGELFIVDQLVMILKQFGYDEVQILVEGQVVETLLGHVSTDQPLSSNKSAEEYPIVEE
ncbi:GerMN domain-containing protein [Rubeoparvulum massiliense]|uniref:GerMN domain-containing protein n=1 Tax=Rubeoparvulum massiliense TaxID=1631346 RepID=UPI00065DC732|nr:GerMN domain-containing protein [Rubeoparvulum massiliense]